MGESERLEELWLKHPNTFRLDAGTAWVGGQEYKQGKDLFIKNPRRIAYGLEGAGDRIGWTEQIIGGQKVAVFTSIEDKSATDRIDVGQLIFMLNVIRAGGIAKVYRECQELTISETLDLPRRKDKKNRGAILERLIEEVLG
jgi:hypothetical protein